MTESVSEISEMIVQGNTEPITDWLNEVISEGALPDEMQRTKVLLEKLAEYKPLAKIEEMEEQNYNMIDNVLNNGAEKAQREANKKNQEQSAVKVSLKARLAEKKAQVEGSGQEHEVQENTKKNNKFTVEEVNLICIFECKSRTKVISDIKKAIKYLDDDEMVELSNRVVAKLDDMTDKEFAEMEFIVTE